MMVLILFLLFALHPPSVAAQLGLQPGNHDLGDLPRGANTTALVTLRNGASEPLEITTRFEGADGVALTATPGTFTLPPKHERQVEVRLQVGQDAPPGAHTARLIATAAAGGGDMQAAGAVTAQLHYHIAALDVAYTALLENETVFIRIVNGHDTTRTVDTSIRMLRQGDLIEGANISGRTVLAGANLLLYQPLRANYTDGTYTLHIQGDASGGPGNETFNATYPVTRSGARFITGTQPAGSAPAGRGGGGGAPGAPGAADPPAPHDRWGPDVLTYPLPEHDVPPAEGREDRASGDAPGDGRRLGRAPLGPTLDTIQDSLSYGMLAAAMALVAGVAVFIGRGRWFH